MLKNKYDFSALLLKHYRWRLIGGHWCCIKLNGCNIKNFPYSLVDFLCLHGFDIPDSISFCIAKNENYWLKFRQSGGLIDIFIKPLNINN